MKNSVTPIALKVVGAPYPTMRPRLQGKVVYVIDLLREGDETTVSTVTRHLHNPPTPETLVATILDMEFGEETDLGMHRPRLGAVADEIQREHREGEKPGETLLRLLTPSWDGFDIDGFIGSSRASSARYVQAVREFRNWFEAKGKTGPPTGYDVAEWLDSQEDTFSTATLRLYYFALRAYARYEANIDPKPPEEAGETYTRDELIAHVQDYADDVGTPTARGIHDAEGYPGIHHYQDEFGSWNEALQAAGLDVNQEMGRYSDAELINALQNFARELGEIPTSTQMAEEGPHSTSTYSEHFGGWLDALRAAGLYEEKYGSYPSEEEEPAPTA